MISLFKEKTSIGVIRLIVLSNVVHADLFLTAPKVNILPDDKILYGLLAPISSLPPFLLIFLFHAIILIQALRLNYILGNNRLFPQSSFLTAMCYILFTALLPSWSAISGALLINFFLIWLIHLLAKLYNSNQPVKDVFNIGFITGICILIFPVAYPLAFIVLLAVLILRPFKINEIFTYLIGIIIPYYFLSAYLFLNNKLKIIHSYLPNFQWNPLKVDEKLPFIVTVLLLAFITLLGFFYMQFNFRKLVIMARKCWIILVILYLLLLPSFLFVEGYNYHIIIIAIAPAAAIGANLFIYNKNKIFLSLLFWLLIFAAWFNNFGLYKYLHK